MDLATFLSEAKASGGAERANAQPFLERLCHVLGLPVPNLQAADNSTNDYVFERAVDRFFDDGTKTTNFIDLYKRDCFVLEAKQSAARRAAKANSPAAPFDLSPNTARRGTATRGTAGWDAAMVKARNQAEAYTRLLPNDHGYPPFVIVVDVGHVIELWADFSRQGKRYSQFPDRQNFRITMDDLLRPDVQDRLRQIWLDPMALDPARRSAKVTGEIAARLAIVAQSLERQGIPAHTTALFLMRCLFTMFAEDVGLLPKDSFKDLLKRKKQSPQTFAPALEQLWQTMNVGGYAGPIDQDVKKFNGWLFKDAGALRLDADEIHELYTAAESDWRDVEPAIFGTLLERALTPGERSKLGAHYTPRAFVEPLVEATIIEPLVRDWDLVQVEAQGLFQTGDIDGAQARVRAFHSRLCALKILDPACGTGNFLYVALELLKRLEGEVLDALVQLGEAHDMLVYEGHTVHPSQFLGLELNPRAVEIAHLVVWLGFLKWQIRTNGLAAIAEPILTSTDHIFETDAVLAYDRADLVRDDQGKPKSRWDGITYRIHPITGERVPDETASIELYTYVKPRRPDWPEADFIIGNPPFIGGKDLRQELGDGYAQALWAAHPKMPGAADFVTYWWDHAAEFLTRKNTRLKRFGFITTNSITQTFSRRVMERRLSDKVPIHLTFAIPDHPWQKAVDKANVRVAMTVAEKGTGEGVLKTVVAERHLDTDQPEVDVQARVGVIRANLSVGADLSSAKSMVANNGLCSRGMSLHGAGFIVTPADAQRLGLGLRLGLENHIRPYRNGRDLADHPREVLVIDLYGLAIDDVQQRFPEVYQHLADRVKPERDQNNRATYRNAWWIFGEPRSELRPALAGLSNFIATVETSKHRLFYCLDTSILPDNKLVNIALGDFAEFAVLCSRIHVTWAVLNGGWMGVGNDPVYVKTLCFDRFPFPDLTPDRRARLRDLGARLHQHRADRMALHPELTMTGIYNVLERVRARMADPSLPDFTPAERDVYDSALIGILRDIHDDIDREVFAAYGFDDLATILVGLPGATMPLDVKPEAQERAEEDLIQRLVDLNVKRVAAEARGEVAWLRPDYQIARFGQPGATEQIEADLVEGAIDKAASAWPKDPLDQITLVRSALGSAIGPIGIDELTAGFKGGRNRGEQVKRVVATLVTLGQAAIDDATNRAYLTR
jgi:hypothetical protein